VARTPDDRERGSMHVMTIPITVGLLSAAVLVIVLVGSATNDRRVAGTAADAAALAATQEWDEHLGLLHGLHLGVSEPAAFWDLAEEVLLGPELEEEMNEAARAYAEHNGAELVDLDIDTEHLRVTAEVRHEQRVPGTEIRSAASATAGITLRGGLCVGDGGLGWLIDGSCLTEPEAEDEVSDDSGDGSEDDERSEDEVEGEPAWAPPEVDGYSSAVVLLR
jgi:signal transduction histidine kinase